MTKSTKIKISNDLKSFNELTEKAVSHMETFIASEGGRLSASTGELYDVIQCMMVLRNARKSYPDSYCEFLTKRGIANAVDRADKPLFLVKALYPTKLWVQDAARISYYGKGLEGIERVGVAPEDVKVWLETPEDVFGNQVMQAGLNKAKSYQRKYAAEDRGVPLVKGKLPSNPNYSRKFVRIYPDQLLEDFISNQTEIHYYVARTTKEGRIELMRHSQNAKSAEYKLAA